jgi:mannose-6-phosphate isomerase-like protein (cupin superfamily)
MALCWLWLNQICEPHAARSGKAASVGGKHRRKNPQRAVVSGMYFLPTGRVAVSSIDDSGTLKKAPHSHANEQIVWMLKGKMEFRLGSEQRVCGPGDVVVIPGGTEHEGWFREDSEVIDFFAPPREDFLLGGKPAYMSEG